MFNVKPFKIQFSCKVYRDSNPKSIGSRHQNILLGSYITCLCPRYGMWAVSNKYSVVFFILLALYFTISEKRILWDVTFNRIEYWKCCDSDV